MTALSGIGAPGEARQPRARRPRGRLRAELRAARMVWQREMIHFTRDRTRAVVALLQPMLFLFVLGTGLSQLFSDSGAGVAAGRSGDYRMFLFPGVLVMAVQAPAISAGASIVWDRQSGFLREMLLAPVRRSTLLVGKCLGGATVATCQGGIVLASAGMIGVDYRPGLFAVLLAMAALTACAMTVLGALLAVTIRSVQTFNTVLTVLVTPLLFLSGLMFPVSALPSAMLYLSLVNPLTYAVDAMRRTFAAGMLGGAAPSPMFDPVPWGSWHPPVALELALVAAFTAGCLVLAGRRFSRSE